MAIENVNKFFEEVSKNEKLMDEVKSIGNNPDTDSEKKAEKIVELAKKTGYVFTVEEFFNQTNSLSETLNDEELDSVAGGVTDAVTGLIIGLGKWAWREIKKKF